MNKYNTAVVRFAMLSKQSSRPELYFFAADEFIPLNRKPYLCPA